MTMTDLLRLMPIDDLLQMVGRALDGVIADELTKYEAQLRFDELGRTSEPQPPPSPPGPGLVWQRATIEQILAARHQRWRAWRVAALAAVKRRIEQDAETEKSL